MELCGKPNTKFWYISSFTICNIFGSALFKYKWKHIFFFIYWKENCGIFSKFVAFLVGNPNLLKIIWNFKKSHVLQFFIRCLFKVVSHILMNKKTLISVLCDNPNNLCVFFVFAAHFIIFDCSLECVRYLFYAFVLKIKQNFLNKFVCLQVVTH